MAPTRLPTLPKLLISILLQRGEPAHTARPVARDHLHAEVSGWPACRFAGQPAGR
jgi:hypothetical protein